VPTTAPSTKTWPSARTGVLPAERLAFFQIGCEAGVTRFCGFSFFVVAVLFVFRSGICFGGCLLFPTKKLSGLANDFFAAVARVRDPDIVRS